MTENVFRAVNIALINELKVIYQALGVDIWEVIDAASTKPFGFMPFYPGPGVGGHCIAVDPFYLVWKSKKDLGYPLRLVELAGEINLEMPRYVVERLTMALDQRFSLPLSLAKILIVGIAYKKNVNDVRESAALQVMRLLRQRGAMVEYHDPHVPSVPCLNESAEFAGWKSADLSKHEIGAFDAIVLATDHDALDYSALAAQARLIVDTRNVFARQRIGGDHIIGA
jgi:UDP-N-acetyl-D-glucosamine dehydrogenase